MALKHDSLRKFRKQKSKWKVDNEAEYEEREDALIKEMLKNQEPTIRGQVRITGGKAKNIKIDIPRKTRPLTDRIKVQIFDVLREDIANTDVLDLYAGSGSFGFEALSRGATSATLVDASKQAERVLLENSKKTGFLTESHITRIKAEDYLQRSVNEGHQFDIIFMDPPYKLYNRRNMHRINTVINGAKELLPGYSDFEMSGFKGAIIMKHPRDYPIEKLSHPRIERIETYTYGRNAISLYIVVAPTPIPENPDPSDE